MHTRNSNQAILKRLVRRVTSPGNLLGRKNISVADKFVATHTHIQGTASHIHTGHGSPYTYRLLSVHTHTHTHTHRPLQSAHIQAIERTHAQATSVRTHTGY